MEMSKLLFLLTELLVFWGQINGTKNKERCRPIQTERDKSIMITAKKSDNVKIICKSRTQSQCEEGIITAILYKDDILLGQLSEKGKRIEYKYRIKNVQMSHSGNYRCIFQNKHGELVEMISVNVSEPQDSNDFVPNDVDEIKRDTLYLQQSMTDVLPVLHLTPGLSKTLRCRFYSRSNASLQANWIRHDKESDFKFGTRLSPNEKLNITMSNECDSRRYENEQCVNTELELRDIASSDNALFTCLLEADDPAIKKIHVTFNLLVDATNNDHRNIKFKSHQIEFTPNLTACEGEGFTIYCTIDDPYLIVYLYKVHPTLDLSRSVVNMNTSLLLRVYLPNFEGLDVASAHINYTILSASANYSGRYVCIIENSLPFASSIQWKSMFLSMENCSSISTYVSSTLKYTLFVIIVVLIFLFVTCLFIIMYCKYNIYRFSKFPIRKIIIVEYDSPIYKGIFNGAKDGKTLNVNSKRLLPDSYPILAPIIKIRPIKTSHRHYRGRNYDEQLPSTSTYRTRLESTQLSIPLENDVFESIHSDSYTKLRSGYEKSSSFVFESMYEFPHDHHWEFPREKLKVTSRKLGEGAFGMVFEGLAKDICGVCGVTKVGVKMMKDDFSDANVLDFMKEIEIMKQIGRNRHVIQLLGVCTQNGPLQVIVEFAPFGNLRDYLRKRCFKSSKGSQYPSTLSRSNLCSYALQIARGMAYLSSRSVVHRDLSARNILVGENYEMKIADFGLTRIVDYYYRKKTDGILPIKWMAPEALLEKKYTTKSDVWSYGILLWEIFSLGDSPYSSTLPENIIAIIQRGVQNPQPLMASFQTYDLMQQCWQLCSENRPDFYQIVDLLKDIYTTVADEPEQNIYHTETLYLEMESGYLEPRESLP